MNFSKIFFYAAVIIGISCLISPTEAALTCMISKTETATDCNICSVNYDGTKYYECNWSGTCKEGGYTTRVWNGKTIHTCACCTNKCNTDSVACPPSGSSSSGTDDTDDTASSGTSGSSSGSSSSGSASGTAGSGSSKTSSSSNSNSKSGQSRVAPSLAVFNTAAVATILAGLRQNAYI